MTADTLTTAQSAPGIRGTLGGAALGFIASTTLATVLFVTLAALVS